jgi:hypothetical protein
MFSSRRCTCRFPSYVAISRPLSLPPPSCLQGPAPGLQRLDSPEPRPSGPIPRLLARTTDASPRLYRPGCRIPTPLLASPRLGSSKVRKLVFNLRSSPPTL